MSEREIVKTNRKHGGKEFRSYFHFIGKISPVRKRNPNTDGWDDVSYYEEGITEKQGKPFRRLQFNLETAFSNNLKIELFAMEQDYAYPYSSTHKKAHKISWADRHSKEKYPDQTYHLILPDWDKAEQFANIVGTDKWVEVKGHYEPQEFVSNDGDGDTIKTVRRVVTSIEPVENGKEIKIGKDKTIKYVCDFNSEDFTEVNYFSMQIGIKSTFQEEESGNTKVNAVYLTYGKDRSEPKDVELVVYQTEREEGKRTLADIFASLNRLDFVEVYGKDNNRAEFNYVPIEEKDDDPFSDAPDDQKQVRYQRVSTGTNKGLEILGVVAGSYIRNFLKEDELQKSADTTTEFPLDGSQEDSQDPFADNSKPLDITDDDLPF